MAVATLKSGSKGDNVKKLQAALNDLGHGTRGSSFSGLFREAMQFGGDGKELKVDGIFGPLTEAMSKAYQMLAGGLMLTVGLDQRRRILWLAGASSSSS